ncbi:sigma factor-like helix-turn-helix DNA-binding protein [Amycolatopsis sp. lyj-84]|uniref:sigma factor-like helix-turn-helix DNA-binding protein n=1 Tax=Amycolatopsis sp. lyj-84 TaxID=2789284 RepID=UPI00397C5D97
MKGYSSVVENRRVGAGRSPLEIEFENIYPVLRAKVLRFVRFRAGWLDCEEMADAVIERLWVRLRGPRPAVREIEAMAIAIAANVVKDAVKKKRPVYTEDIVGLATRLGAWITGDQDGYLDLLAAVGQLEPDLREALGLVFFDEQSVVQAARILRVGRGVVRRRVDRALAELRRMLVDRPPGQT